MEDIQHRTVNVNGINMHVAEKGEGPVILFLHGFPELWYSWRYQINTLAAQGYRAVAPDLRGFGDTDAPSQVVSYTCFHVVGDIIGLLDAVAADQEKVYVVRHDWGAIIAWFLCLFRPDRVKALVNLSVMFIPVSFDKSLLSIEALRAYYGDDYYMYRFQVPGEIEAEFSQIGTEKVLKKLFTFRTPGPLMLPKGKGHPADAQIPLPSWLSEEDMKYYTSKFEKKGFTGGINYYRNIDLNRELMAPWAGSKIQIPVKFISGDLDLVYYMPGNKEYIHKGGFKRDVPLLEDVIIMEGVGHYINQEKGEEISKHIYDFFKKHP